jgi:pyruvate dehydrogenase E2 component (dihydrolipoamide acetyltransferase)
MPLFEFKLPDLGEGVAEGEVVAWHVEAGQDVHEDQELVEVMTDKATVSIGAPRTGRIAELCVQVGERVPVGRVLVVIETGEGAQKASDARTSSGLSHDFGNGAARATNVRSRAEEPHAPALRSPATEPPAATSGTSSASTRSTGDPGNGMAQAVHAHGRAPTKPTSVTASAVGDIRESLPGTGFLSRTQAPARVPASTTQGFFANKPLATPATRKLARDLGIDLRTVPPSGQNGRVTKDDVSRLGQRAPESESRGDPAREVRKPFVGLRRRIAERMQLSVQKAAHFTFVEEVDVGALKDVVESLKPTGERLGVKLHYLPFIVKAVTLALKKHAVLNSTLDERTNELVYRHYYHIGIATATEQGLVVPVVRDADRKSPLEIATEIQRLSGAARAGTLTSAELSGSTFTITSLGRMGGLLATPVLNYPEVGILGVHRVKEKPVVRAGQIVIGNVMLLSLSFDHRIIDGHVGAAFAYDLIAYLEQPELLLISLA